MVNINDIEIDHCGSVKTIGDMIEHLQTGYASYWHWHIVLTKTISLYNSAKNDEGYGILLPDSLVVKGKSVGLLEDEIARGVYDTDRLIELVKIYEFLFIGGNG